MLRLFLLHRFYSTVREKNIFFYEEVLFVDCTSRAVLGWRWWNTDMTLAEVCKVADVTRRAVQGYEKAGLIIPTGKTSRGYLLYNTKTVERIKEIKWLQQLGFTLNEKDSGL